MQILLLRIKSILKFNDISRSQPNFTRVAASKKKPRDLLLLVRPKSTTPNVIRSKALYNEIMLTTHTADNELSNFKVQIFNSIILVF